MVEIGLGPTVIISGLKETKAYLHGMNVNITNASEYLPKVSAEITKRQIQNLKRTEARWVGNYHQTTGTGLADSIEIRRAEKGKFKNSYIVGPHPKFGAITNPITGNSIDPPFVYAKYVEFGHSGLRGTVRGRHYFKRGLNRAIPSVYKKVRDATKRIIKK